MFQAGRAKESYFSPPSEEVNTLPCLLVGDAPAAWREALQRMVVGDKVHLWVSGPDESEEKAAEDLDYEIELLALR